MSKKWLVLLVVLGLAGAFALTSNPRQPESTGLLPNPNPPAQQVAETKPSPSIPKEDPWLIVPGVRVGAITPQSTLADLQKAFGAENVHEGKVDGAEGDTYDGAVIYPKDEAKSLEIIWTNQGLKNKSHTPEVILIRGEQSQWHTANGITLGTSLITLETLNGGPFTLSGFDWDYGGTVLSWGDNGRLKEKFQKNGNLILRLSPSERAPEEPLSAVLGDRDFSSSDPNMRAVRPIVEEITVMFPR